MSSFKKYPLVFPTLGDTEYHQSGMLLRDWFAGQALVGLCSSPDLGPEHVPMVTSAAYILADAMLESRVKGENP